MILFFASTFNKEQKIIEVNLNIEDFRIIVGKFGFVGY